MKWSDVNVGYKFKDGSCVTQVKDTEDCECFSVEGTVLSSDHLLLSSYKLPATTLLFWVNIIATLAYIGNTFLKFSDGGVFYYTETFVFLIALIVLWLGWRGCKRAEMQSMGILDKIPVEENVHVQKEQGEITQRFETTKTDTRLQKMRLLSCEYFAPVKDIYERSTDTHPIKIMYDGKYVIPHVEYKGVKPCFCVTTDTGRYETNKMVHHNSVCLRNVIFHSLTHADDIKLALVDLKQSEFESYKKLKDVVGVANNEREAVEILRMARECMYKRNKENAARGITDFVDYEPQEPLPVIKIFGREFDENQEFDVQVEKEGQTEIVKMKAKDILDYLN